MGTITLDGIDFPVRHASLARSASGVELAVDGGHADVPEEHDFWILEPRLCLSAASFAPGGDVDVLAIPCAGECQCCLVTHDSESVTRAEIRITRTAAGHHLSASGEATILGNPVHFRVETPVELSP